MLFTVVQVFYKELAEGPGAALPVEKNVEKK